MKTLLRLGASVAFAVTTGTVCFAQHYTQTSLVSNAGEAARVTDPQLINAWARAGRFIIRKLNLPGLRCKTHDFFRLLLE